MAKLTMYENVFTRANPGFVIFMIDQSASMSQIGYEGRPLAETAADIVNNMVLDMSMIFPRGSTIRMNAHIAIIVYGGGGPLGDVELIRYGFIDEIVQSPIRTEVIKRKYYADEIGFYEIEIEKPIIIEPNYGYLPNMTFAFQLAHTLINDWKERCCEDNHHSSLTPSPIVINITKGTNVGNDEELLNLSNQIKNIEFEDGNPLIVSILIPTHPSCFDSLSLPTQKLFDVNLRDWETICLSSSNVPEELIDTFIEGGFTDVSQESKLLFVNPDNTVKDRIIDCLIGR